MVMSNKRKRPGKKATAIGPEILELKPQKMAVVLKRNPVAADPYTYAATGFLQFHAFNNSSQL